MNKAEGEKQSRILRSEAAMQEDVNKALAACKAAESEKLSRILESEAEMQTRINMAKAAAESAQSEKVQKILSSEAEKQALVREILCRPSFFLGESSRRKSHSHTNGDGGAVQSAG